VNSGEEIPGEFVVTCGNSPKVLEFIEEALDEIAFAVESVVASPLGLSVGLGRDDGNDFALGQGVDERIGIERLVADQGIWIGGFNQRFRASQIVGLTWREHQFDGISQSIDKRVDFGGQSAAGSADRLFTVFFSAPALCW
jgi:hypothetical protein